MIKDMLKEVLGSGVGKAGALLLTILVILSIVSIPMHVNGFANKKWNNPAYWADHPKAVPPANPSWLYSNKIPHQVMTQTLPDAVESSDRELRYEFHVSLASAGDPTFLSFTIEDVRFQNSSPVIEVYLEDGAQQVFLYRHVVPGKSSGEMGPVKRYSDVPFRTNLTADFFVKARTKMFFDTLRQKGAKEFTAVVRVKVADTGDAVGTTKFVAGGNAYGWLGTDNVGRDIWQGMLFGLSLAMIIGLVTAFFTTLIGAVAAGVGGYKSGKTDAVIQQIIAIMMTIPTLVLLIFLANTIGSRLIYVIAFMIIFGWGSLVLYLRSWIKQIRETGFIMNARLRGLSGTRIIFRHILPQTMPVLFASFVLTVSGAILAEAGLSFLGLGDPSLPTWGQMLNQAFQTGAHTLGYWWWMLPPMIGIVLMTIKFCWIFLALEPVVEPRLKRH